MFVKNDGKVRILDENGTAYQMSFTALMGIVYWAYNKYTVESIEEGNTTFAGAVEDFLECKAKDYTHEELL